MRVNKIPFALPVCDVLVVDLPFSVGDLPFSVEELIASLRLEYITFVLKAFVPYISYIIIIIVTTVIIVITQKIDLKQQLNPGI